jgi:hypothetical protein
MPPLKARLRMAPCRVLGMAPPTALLMAPPTAPLSPAPSYRALGLGTVLGHLYTRSALQEPDAAASSAGVRLR